MGKSEKKILGYAAALLVGWVVLFYMLVYPMWNQRDEAIAEAQKKLERLEKLTKSAPKTWDITKANESLAAEAAALQVMLTELKAIEAGDLGSYSMTENKGGDPNTFFSRLRKELIEKILSDQAVQLAPAIAGDLGFRDKASNDPTALNLVRLHVVDRFYGAAKAAGVHEITTIQYLDAATTPRPEGLEIESLIQVPIVVRLRLSEATLGPLLYHLEPNPKHSVENRYFCVRGLQAVVKDEKSGLMDVLLNVGALYTQTQMKTQGVTPKDESRPQLFNNNRVFVDPNRY